MESGDALIVIQNLKFNFSLDRFSKKVLQYIKKNAIINNNKNDEEG